MDIKHLGKEVVIALPNSEAFKQYLLWRAAEEAKRQNERFGLRGSLENILYKEDGRIIVSRKDNLIVDAGFDFIAHSIGNRAASGATAAMGWIAIGTTNTAPAAGQTALVAELARQAASFSHTVGTKVFTFSTTFAAGTGTGAIVEAGVFNASSTGTMLDRVTFSVINKGAGDSLAQTFTFTMS